MKQDYYNTKETVEEYIKLAEGVDGKRLIEKMKPFVHEGAKILELGSGPGTDWELLNQTFNVIGSDNSNEFLARLRAKFHDGEFLALDATTLTVSIELEAIYSNKVLHHLSDQELKQSVKNQHKLLCPNGIICHSFWKGDGSEVFNGLFVNYHSKEALEAIFGAYFSVLLLEEYPEFETDDSLLLIARKK